MKKENSSSKKPRVLFFLYSLGIGGTERIISLVAQNLQIYDPIIVTHDKATIEFDYKGNVETMNLKQYKFKPMRYT